MSKEADVVLEKDEDKSEIVAEIEGEVSKPGVYKLASGSRVDDLIKVAGEIKETADFAWVQKNINRAAKLSDGAKIYIPSKDFDYSSNIGGVSSQGLVIGVNSDNQAPMSGLININSASQSQLEALWGIGPATAKKIIEGRPYSTVEELITRKILKKNVYEANKDKLTVY